MSASKQNQGFDQAIADDHKHRFLDIASELTEIGADFYTRGWVLGTGGNFSSVLSLDPLRVAITPTGSHKGALIPSDILEINEAGEVLAGSSRPSFEYMLHLAIIQARGAGAVLHTHSIWATILSCREAAHVGLAIEGYEMLKGLEGVSSHQHREWLPILSNSQDMVQLARVVESILDKNPNAHGFLLEGHGLYTWGQSLKVARRHVEIIEFLLEVVGRTDGARGPDTHQQK
jgi:methylthioribulose-1-phosphate dehydratase